MVDLDVLWQSLALGGLEVPNRVVVSADGARLTGAANASEDDAIFEAVREAAVI
jgi:hypothetical protein